MKVMKRVFIVRRCEYWRNYRGECGSMHSIEKVFESEDKAKRYIAEARKNGINQQTKDTSDEPERWVRLTDRTSGEFKMDMWYDTMIVE